MSEKYTILTGATGAIGFEIARALASRGERLILACRNTSKAEAVRQRLASEYLGTENDADIPNAPKKVDIPGKNQQYADTEKNVDISEKNQQYAGAKILVAQLDLADDDSVRAFVNTLKTKNIAVHALINNAGVMNRRFTTDARGRELTVLVNYYNTRLLTELVADAYPALERVVFTTSLTRRFFRRNASIDITPDTFSQLGTYGRSKRAITEFAAQFAAAHPGMIVTCGDPGIVDTSMIHMERWYDGLADIFFRPLIRSPKHGAIPTLRAYSSSVTARIYGRHLVHRL
jgi:NAD(P)-dependent dehydrogenase (short-subunit alcohol dehydrogenase family)